MVLGNIWWLSSHVCLSWNSLHTLRWTLFLPCVGSYVIIGPTHECVPNWEKWSNGLKTSWDINVCAQNTVKVFRTIGKQILRQHLQWVEHLYWAKELVVSFWVSAEALPSVCFGFVVGWTVQSPRGKSKDQSWCETEWICVKKARHCIKYFYLPKIFAYKNSTQIFCSIYLCLSEHPKLLQTY